MALIPILLGGTALWLLARAGAKAVPAAFTLHEFMDAIPSRAALYGAALWNAGARYGIDPFILAAIMERESDSGQGLTPRGPGGTGDFKPRPWKNPPMPADGKGWALGLMQLDRAVHQAWADANDWAEPSVNINKGAEVLKSVIAYMIPRVPPAIAVRAGIAAYNAGQGRVATAIATGELLDSVTTGGNYSTDVLARAASYRARLPPPRPVVA
jgi:soluble lytic murein transglycosylase-like protein